MKTTVRFENAVRKLYKAFHDNKLNALCCTKCAVGNICDNDPAWGIVCSGYLDYNNYNGRSKKVIDSTGYNPKELRIIEEVFITGNRDLTVEFWDNHPETKEEQFQGLCAVVEYLCELDNIPNPMDYSALFETENDRPKLELQSVFQ